jgi:hypothetical protein
MKNVNSLTEKITSVAAKACDERYKSKFVDIA